MKIFYESKPFGKWIGKGGLNREVIEEANALYEVLRKCVEEYEKKYPAFSITKWRDGRTQKQKLDVKSCISSDGYLWIGGNYIDITARPEETRGETRIRVCITPPTYGSFSEELMKEVEEVLKRRGYKLVN